MADKVTLATISTFVNDTTAATTFNNNMAAITTAMDNSLSLNGLAPNAMQANLDMNSNAILNLPAPVSPTSPVRVIDAAGNPTITVPPVGTSGATVPLLNGNNTWSALQNYGPLSFVPIALFGAGSTNSWISGVRGTAASPIVDGSPVALFQASANVSTTDPNSGANTVYVSMAKKGTALNDYHGISVEAVDSVGGTGSSIAAGRFYASQTGGVLADISGLTAVGVSQATSTSFAAIVGAESQVWNMLVDATTTFSTSSFSCASLASCEGTHTADAGFLINPFSPGTVGKSFITGFLVPTNSQGAGNDTVIDTAFRCDASCVNGIDLSRGTFSGFSIKIPGLAKITNNTAAISPASGTMLQILGADSANNIIDMRSNSNNSLRGFTTGGTLASPAATIGGSLLIGILGGGWANGGFVTAAARIALISNTNPWSATDTSSYIALETTPVGSTTRAEAIRILPGGNVQFTNAANFSANGAVATSLGSVGPTGSHTTVQKWLTITDGSNTFYIPCF